MRDHRDPTLTRRDTAHRHRSTREQRGDGRRRLQVCTGYLPWATLPGPLSRVALDPCSAGLSLQRSVADIGQSDEAGLIPCQNNRDVSDSRSDAARAGDTGSGETNGRAGLGSMIPAVLCSTGRRRRSDAPATTPRQMRDRSRSTPAHLGLVYRHRLTRGRGPDRRQNGRK